MANADAATIESPASDLEHRQNFQAANNADKHDQQRQPKKQPSLPDNTAATAAATKAWSAAWDQVGNWLSMLAGAFYFTMALIVWPFLTLFNGLRLMAGNLFGGNSKFRFQGASVPLVPPYGARGMIMSSLSYVWVSLWFLIFLTIICFLGYIATSPWDALKSVFDLSIKALWDLINFLT